MSKLTDVAATSHVLSVVAMEEASRLDERTADLEHLLLALTVDAGIAGQVLRGSGVILGATRDAIATEHREAVASFGMHVPAPEPGEIRFHKTDGYEWSERAMAVIRRAGEGGGRGDAPAVLRALVREPSGLIGAILARLGTTPDAVIEKVDEAERYPAHRMQQAVTPTSISGVSEAFVAAPQDAVWELLVNPARMPDWDPTIGSVDDGPAAPGAGATWSARSRTQRPDGKEIRVRADIVRQHVEVLVADKPHAIEWRYSFPDAPGANARCVRVELEPAAGGTQLRIFLVWERSSARSKSRLLGWLARPLTRFAVWLQLMQLGSGVSRAFR